MRFARYWLRSRGYRLIRAPEDTGPVAARAQLRIARLLGRGYLAGLRVREQARIERSRAPERLEPARVVATLVRRQRGVLITLLALIVVGLTCDVLVHDYARDVEKVLGIRQWRLEHLSLPTIDTLRVLLAATAGATGTILGIVLSISLIVFQTTAERYGSARIVRFLLRERTGSAVVRLLALGFAYSLCVLILLEVVDVARPPYVSTAIALLVSIAGVLALITYRTEALLGYLPTSIAGSLTREMLYEISRAAERSSGRSVQHHSRQVVDEDMRTQLDLLRHLVSSAQDAFGVASVIRAANHLLGDYLVNKRKLSDNSEWWEREAVRTDTSLTRVTEHLASRGLMDPTSQQANRQWLEHRVLVLMSEVIASDLVNEADVRDAAIDLLLRNLQVAFHMQEFDVCLALLDSLRELAATNAAVNDDVLAERLTQVAWILFNLLGDGIGFNAAHVVDSEPWKHPVDHLSLRWMERNEAEVIGRKIARERAIVGGVVTPGDAMIAEVERSVAPKKAEITERLTGEGYSWLHQRLLRTLEAKAPTSGVVAKQVLRALLRAINRGLEFRLPEDFPKLVAEAFEIETDATVMSDLREDTALLARNLAETGQWDSCWRVVRAAAILGTLAEHAESDMNRRTELVFDILMTLAHIHAWAEFTGEPEHVRRLSVYLERPWRSLDSLATMVSDERFSTTRTLSFVTGVKYQRWFQTLLIAANALPPDYEMIGDKRIPVERGKLHRSSLFREWSTIGDYDDCLTHLVRSCVAVRAQERRQLLLALHAYAQSQGAEQ